MKRKIESMAVAAHNSAALLALPDCVFLQENGRCSRLNREACAGEDCSFLTTHERSDQGRYKWASRLSALSEARQSEIAKKLTVKAAKFSAAAKEKIEAAGGSCEEV